jgi:hypothetical protein
MGKEKMSLAGRTRHSIPEAQIILPLRWLLLLVAVWQPHSASPQAALFREVAATTGLIFQHFNGATGKHFMAEMMGAGVALFDYDNDGDLDVYLVQGTTLDNQKPLFPLPKTNKLGHRLFRNDLIPSGKFRFVDATEKSGLGLVGYGMGVATGDYDNDGDEDLLVTNLTKEGSTLYRNNGKALFTDASMEFNLAQSSLMFTGFGVAWFDYDNDGWLDLFAANGAVTKLPALRGHPFPFHQRNQLFHNEAGQGFKEILATNMPALQLSEVSRAAAFGDLDNDGDVDCVVTNNNGLARLLLNENATRNHWLQCKLVGKQDNHQALGATVIVQAKGQPALRRRVHTDGSYLSANDARVHFGLGKATTLETVLVEWPNGTRESFPNVKLDALNLLQQGTGGSRK